MVEPGTMLVPKCTEINDTKINNIKMSFLGFVFFFLM